MAPCEHSCSLPWWACHLDHSTPIVAEYGRVLGAYDSGIPTTREIEHVRSLHPGCSLVYIG